jgi:hypothetical protein
MMINCIVWLIFVSAKSCNGTNKQMMEAVQTTTKWSCVEKVISAHVQVPKH